ncbi:basic region leucine zipper protein [Ceratobasidium sp. AG-Ba]|nr:basic region leucine zipper protein [Ceratobasidium sp. AG-Ba]
MAPSNLQGLNLIHPESPPSNLTDAQDLLSTPIFPDFAPNDLDLWSTINFASDEPFVSAKDRQLKAGQTEPSGADDKEANVPTTAPTGQEPQFDFAQFLANFGLHPNDNPGVVLAGGLPQGFGAPLVVPPVPTPAPSAAQSTASTPAPEAAPPAPKRARTAKTPAPATSTSSDAPSSSEPNTSTPLTAAEDKRRRNTAASARFRLKKKEREAALDARAHALEDRVTELERECESLRRENGWLRGLVVGVTGGVVPTMSDAPILAPGSAPPSTSGPTPAQTATADKRKRDEEAT